MAELSGGDADGEALLAFLRAHPEALRTGDLPLDLAASKLAHSLEAFRAGERERALDLAISSYLDGFEPVEPALSVVDAALRKNIEADYIRYREALREGRPLTEVSALQPLGRRRARAGRAATRRQAASARWRSSPAR